MRANKLRLASAVLLAALCAGLTVWGTGYLAAQPQPAIPGGMSQLPRSVCITSPKTPQAVSHRTGL